MATEIMRFEYPANEQFRAVIGFRIFWLNKMRVFYFRNFDFPAKRSTKRGQWWKRGGIEHKAPHGLKFTTFRANNGIRLVMIELASGKDFHELPNGSLQIENIHED